MASPPPQQQYVAAVVGSTGATGAALLQALTSSQRFSKVLAIARSPAESASEKIITPVKLDLDQLTEAASAATAASAPSSSSSSSSKNPLEGVDAVFVALGTTRASAGSAEAFWKVDVGGVASAAALAAAARAPFLSLVSASGASRNGWRPTSSLLHPLYYAAAKGAAEQEAIEYREKSGVSSSSVAIYRPGLLDRGADRQRGGERWAIRCGLPSLPVGDLAAVMVADAVAALDKNREAMKESGSGGEVVVVKGDGEIKKEAAALSSPSR